jgi:hypothetical protein
MFTYNERDLHRMPTPARSHLPMKDYIAASGILDDETTSANANDADVALLRLPAPSLRGTFAKAYGLLATLVSEIGWDELLKCRSQVFVMEEEYRMQKAAPESNGKGKSTGIKDVMGEEEEGFGPLAIESDEADDDASVQGLHSDTPAIAITPVEGANGEAGIPTIKVSTDSDGERERKAISAFEELSLEGLEKPALSVQGEWDEPTATLPVGLGEDAEVASGSFNNKRLCERWLDNLFMVLYEVRSPPLLFLRVTDGVCAGSTSLHNLASRGSALQSPTSPVPQDRH